MLLVEEIMTKPVFSIPAEDSAEQAAWSLTLRGFSGAPVVDKDGAVIGMLSKSDLVDPGPRDWIVGEAKAIDLSSPQVYAVYAGDPALAAAQLMAKRKLHRVLVLDDESQPVGMVSASDVVKAVADGKRFDID